MLTNRVGDCGWHATTFIGSDGFDVELLVNWAELFMRNANLVETFF